MDTMLNLSEYKINTTHDVEFTIVEMSVRSAVVLFVSVTIILSNLLNFIFLKTTKHMSPGTNIFLTNLTVADFCAGLIGCLPSIAPAITGTWPYGDIWCQISGVIHGSSATVSIWSIGVIGVERYIAISHPLFYKQKLTPRTYLGIVCFLWTFAITIVLIPATTHSSYVLFHFDRETGLCGLYCEAKWVCNVKVIIVLVLSGSVIIFTTTSTVKTLRQKTAAKTRTGISAMTERGISQRQTPNPREQKAVRLVIVTTGLYFLAWGPYSTIVFLENLGISIRSPGMLDFILLWIANSNCFVNVFIYSAIYPSFKLRLKKLMYRIFCCGYFRPGARVESWTASET